MLIPLSREDVERAVDKLVSNGVESLAVCLLNSYASPHHEEQVAALIRQRHPHLQLSISSEILREMKEYERTSTVVVNAYVLPLMQGYIGL